MMAYRVTSATREFWRNLWSDGALCKTDRRAIANEMRAWSRDVKKRLPRPITTAFRHKTAQRRTWRVNLGAMSAICALCFSQVPQGIAGPLPMLDAESRQQWQAVGRVNGAGFRNTSGCSGTLVAPDLVLTAAHCVTSDGRLWSERHFLAGWFRGEFTAHRVSKDIQIHPLYALTTGAPKFAYDIAMIRLLEPIERALLPPVDLLPRNAVSGSTGLLLGYQNTRPHALSGAAGCPRKPLRASKWVIYGCEVISGTSGGAVMIETQTGWKLGAVIVARQGAAGEALAVPVNDWIRDAVKEAQKREDLRK